MKEVRLMMPEKHLDSQTTVLIVDDEKTTRNIFKHMLVENGFKTLDSSSGREGIGLFSEFKPDVVLLDAIMPEMDGFETCSIIRSMAGGQDTIIVLITALQDDEFVDRAFQAGADDFIIKPVKWSVLLHRIRLLAARKEADQKRQAAEEKYCTILENTTDWIFLTDHEGYFIYCSSACEALTGHTADDFMDDRHLLLNIIYPNDLPLYVKHQMAERDMEDSQELIFRLIRQDGQIRYIEHRCRPVLDERGKLSTIRGSNRDITERILAEKRLQATEKRLKDIIDFLPDPTYVLDLQGRVLFWNHAIEVFSGVKSADMIGKANYEHSLAVYGRRMPVLADMMLDPNLVVGSQYTVCNRSRDRIEAEGWIDKANNLEPVYIWALVVPLYDENNEMVGVIQNFRDITELKQAENLLRDQSKQLAILNQIIVEANKSGSLQETLDVTVQLVLNLLAFDGGCIYLLNEAETKAELYVSRNLPDEITKELHKAQFGVEPYSSIFHKGESVFAEDYSRLRSDYTRDYGMISAASIALMAGSRVVGAMNLVSYRKRVFSEGDKEILIAIGKEVGSLIVSDQSTEALKRSEEKFRSLVEQSVDGISILDSSGRVIEWNRGMERILGIRREEAVNEELWVMRRTVDPNIKTETDYQRLKNGMMKALNTGKARWLGEYTDMTLISRTGVIKQTQYNSFILESSQGNMMGIIIRDITKTKELEAKLRFMGLHDSLTSLHNRAFFNEEMRRLESGRLDPVAILVCDLDFFKQLNDTLGHQAGDHLLIDVGQILKSSFRENDVIARMGGDEFAVILNRSDEDQALAACQRIARNIAEYNQSAPVWPVSMSIGYAVRNGEKVTLEEIYRRADAMMYANKSASKSILPI